MKVATACTQCRTGKRKCASADAKSCRQCLARRIACSFGVDVKHPISIAPRNETQSLLPRKAERVQIIDLYLTYVHNKPHTLFHEPTLHEQVLDESIEPAILYGLLALGARFLPNSIENSHRAEYAAESRRLLKAKLERACLENVQASLLNSEFAVGEGEHEIESLYFGIAVRMSQFLRLDVVREEDDAIREEVSRRVWWTCYIVGMLNLVW